MANLDSLTINDTGYLGLAAGTNDQRPNSPSDGYMRYNTDLDLIEVFYSSDWVDIATGNIVTGVVTGGLVLYLDAGNSTSYPGSGTTWFDLSGNNLNSTLVNGVTYSSNDNGQFIFDGVDDYISGNTDLTSEANELFCDGNGNFSVSIWYKWVTNPTVWQSGTSNSSHAFVAKMGGIGNSGTFGIYGAINQYAPAVGDTMIYGRAGIVIRGDTTIASPTLINDATWHNSVFTWDGTTGKIYFDSNYYKNAFIGDATLQDYPLGFGTRSGDTFTADHALEGSISTCMVYNRALSAAEVQQNFNVTKGRFGL